MRRVLILVLLILGFRSHSQLSSLSSYHHLLRQPDEFVEELNLINTYPDSLGFYVKFFDRSKFQNGTITEDDFYSFWGNLKCTDSLELAFDDPKWVAFLYCDVKYQGKIETLILALSPRLDDNIGYVSWRVINCIAPFLDDQSNEIKTLSPISHNMDFMQIGKHFDHNPADISSIIDVSHHMDHLSAVEVLFRHELLQMIQVKNVSFYYQFNFGYNIQIEEVVEENQSHGWRIVSLSKPK